MRLTLIQTAAHRTVTSYIRGWEVNYTTLVFINVMRLLQQHCQHMQIQRQKLSVRPKSCRQTRSADKRQGVTKVYSGIKLSDTRKCSWLQDAGVDKCGKKCVICVLCAEFSTRMMSATSFLCNEDLLEQITCINSSI